MKNITILFNLYKPDKQPSFEAIHRCISNERCADMVIFSPFISVLSSLCRLRIGHLFQVFWCMKICGVARFVSQIGRLPSSPLRGLGTRLTNRHYSQTPTPFRSRQNHYWRRVRNWRRTNSYAKTVLWIRKYLLHHLELFVDGLGNEIHSPMRVIHWNLLVVGLWCRVSVSALPIPIVPPLIFIISWCPSLPPFLLFSPAFSPLLFYFTLQVSILSLVFSLLLHLFHQLLLSEF